MLRFKPTDPATAALGGLATVRFRAISTRNRTFRHARGWPKSSVRLRAPTL